MTEGQASISADILARYAELGLESIEEGDLDRLNEIRWRVAGTQFQYAVRGGSVWSNIGSADTTSPYALTGAVFAQDRRAIVEATSALRHAARSVHGHVGSLHQPGAGARAQGADSV